MWIRTSVAMAILAAVATAAPAQAPKLPGFISAVKTTVTPAVLKPGTKATLTVAVTIAPGYHIYSTDPGDEYAIATELAPLKAAGVTYGKASWPKPTLHDKVRIHEGTAVVTIPIAVAKTAKPGAVKIGASIKAQGCNETACLPPDTFTAVATVMVGK